MRTYSQFLYNRAPIVLILVTLGLFKPATAQKKGVDAEFDLLQLLHLQEKWVKVHAAEFLIWENIQRQQVQNVYIEEEKKFRDTVQYRIGVWRVLAQTAQTSQDRDDWINRIVDVYNQPNSPDRLHAIETLSKLKHSVVADVNEIYRELDLGVNSFLLYSLWNSAYLPGADVELIRSDFVDLLERTSRSTDPVLIAVTAFILRNLPPPTPSEWDRISVTALSYNDNSGVRASLLSTAWLLAPHTGESVTREKIRRELLAMENEEGAMMHILTALGASDQTEDRKILAELYHRVRDVNSPSYDADLHATAAYAILRSKRDNGHRFE